MSRIDIFIVWRERGDPLILGIYKDVRLAIKICQEYNEYDEDDIMDRSETNQICEDASVIGCDDSVYCTKIQIDENTNALYFLKIMEHGGGGSYHLSMWLCVEEDQSMIIDHAINYFENEHNRDDECEDCPNCLEEMIKSLKTEQFASITCTSYEGTDFEIWSYFLTSFV